VVQTNQVNVNGVRRRLADDDRRVSDANGACTREHVPLEESRTAAARDDGSYAVENTFFSVGFVQRVSGEPVRLRRPGTHPPPEMVLRRPPTRKAALEPRRAAVGRRPGPPLPHRVDAVEGR
jgi:hypothetical protein